jgi:hypothetical protein
MIILVIKERRYGLHLQHGSPSGDNVPIHSNSWSRITEKLKITQMVNKFPALYGIRGFITVLSPLLEPFLNQMNPVHTLTFP